MGRCTRTRALVATGVAGAAAVPALAVLPAPLALLAAVLLGSAAAQVGGQPVRPAAPAAGRS
ncbi:MAG: hypothetical protein KY451_02095 [Actinobacteria bacterium]|nr:hypothetical protein [Actinomycetota bacterium]MBW3647506.1 hypothetical protein [Actinomycetota bacterium]